jgi:hypothetical protein
MPVKLVAASRPITSLEDIGLLTQDTADDDDDNFSFGSPPILVWGYDYGR